jgi:CubicO group peptidase (beta-lactamase class C family)
MLLTRRLVLLLALLLPAPIAAQSLRAADAAVGNYLNSDSPGIAVLVMQGDQILHMRGYGFADIATQSPVTPDSLFDLASVSKQMTALAVMLQLRDGLYTLDTPIGDILAPFAHPLGANRPITVRDLIHHVSGLPDYLDGTFDYQSDTTDAEIVAWLARQPLLRRPGIVFDYSNSGYVTLGSLVAAADNAESLADVLRARVWEPLGMEQVFLVGPMDPVNTVMGYIGSDGDFQESVWYTLTQGDGNVFISLRDLALYEAALATNALLTPKETARLFLNGTYDDGRAIDDGAGDGYGFGWSTFTYNGQTYAAHSGSWSGTSTWYQRNLTTGITIIVLANGEDMDPSALAADIEAAL